MTGAKKQGGKQRPAPRLLKRCPTCRAGFDHRSGYAVCDGPAAHHFNAYTGKKLGSGPLRKGAR